VVILDVFFALAKALSDLRATRFLLHVSPSSRHSALIRGPLSRPEFILNISIIL
jgi:hypothetical protein